MIIKKFEEYIKESFGSGYGLTMTSVNKDGDKNIETLSFKRIEDARMFMIDWLSKHPSCSIEYFDICSGNNYSDPDCLEVWGGLGGYFANIVNGGYKHNQQFTYREIKNIERSEVDLNTYLKII